MMPEYRYSRRTQVTIHINQTAHLPDFIRLNQRWIQQYFQLEAADHALAADPEKVIRDGGYIFSLEHEGKIAGVCALFRDTPQRMQLARMAVDPEFQGKGFGWQLMEFALNYAKEAGVQSVYLLSNTCLNAAISMYEKPVFRPSPETSILSTPAAIS
jgi:N-acetylglutamate synthase-like GNAT family acetyltransferase